MWYAPSFLLKKRMVAMCSSSVYAEIPIVSGYSAERGEICPVTARRVQDLNLCLPYGRTVFETVALNRSANPPRLYGVRDFTPN